MSKLDNEIASELLKVQSKIPTKPTSKSSQRPLISTPISQKKSKEQLNPIISFHVNTILPKKPKKEDIFKTTDSQSTSFEKYGMFYSFETPSIYNYKNKPEKGCYKYFSKGKARIVFDVNKLNRFILEEKPKVEHRKKMVDACPKLKNLYHLSRDLSPLTHAIARDRCKRNSIS